MKSNNDVAIVLNDVIIKHDIFKNRNDIFRLVHISESINTNMLKHKLDDLLLVILISFLHQIYKIENMTDFIEKKQSLLKDFGLFNDGILPSNEIFRFVLLHLDPLELYTTALVALQNLITNIRDKTIVNSNLTTQKLISKGNNINIHDISSSCAFMCKLNQEKTNKNTQALDMLTKLGLERTIVTLEDTFSEATIIITERKGDYILAINDNELCNKIKNEFDKVLLFLNAESGTYYYTNEYINNNEFKKNEFFILDCMNILDIEKYSGARNIIYNKITICKNGYVAKIIESFYITSLNPLLLVSEVIIKRGEVENGLYKQKKPTTDEEIELNSNAIFFSHGYFIKIWFYLWIYRDIF